MAQITIYFCKDDPLEKVKIVSQERHPNGRIVFEFVAPESVAGTQATLLSGEFFARYKDPAKIEAEQGDPPRPSSMGTMQQWRRYALWLEKKYHTPKPPVYRNPGRFDPNAPYDDGAFR